MEVINVDHTNFLVKTSGKQHGSKTMAPASTPKSSWRLLTNALIISYRIKVAQNKIIIHIDLLEKLKINVLHTNFLLEV